MAIFGQERAFKFDKQGSANDRYLNRSMLLKGKVYWAKDIDLPIIQPEKIHLDPILSD